MAKVHNLDENISDSFEFIVKGHTYKFAQPNTEEMEEFGKIEGDESKFKEFLYKFISPVSKDSPKFESIAKKMIGPQWSRFTKMVESEFKG